MHEYLASLMGYFSGLTRAHGHYRLPVNYVKDGQKVEGKATTVQKPVTAELWQDHLAGTYGLGIIPIDDDSTCQFGAIDIDQYSGLNIQKILAEIHRLSLPLVPCLTKSGGLHLYCFLSEKIPAGVMREKLAIFAGILGHGQAEIFPKQDKVLSERGDIGSWINMPYFDCLTGQSRRVALDIASHQPLTLPEFITAVGRVRWTAAEFTAYAVVQLSDFSDGPPCLQYILEKEKGFQTGSRNDGLFNIGVYLKKSRVDNWRQYLDEYNVKYCEPPLSSAEVQVIFKGLRKKDYLYTCNRPPICGFCNKAECQLRKHGIGNDEHAPKLSNLSKFTTDPPIWFVTVENCGRLELATEDLQSQMRFQRRCLNTLSRCPSFIGNEVWQGMLQKLLETLEIIEAPVDASPRGQLLEHLERFCTARSPARVKDEILLSKVWTNTDDKRHLFRISDFMAYLERVKFKDFKVNQVCAILKDIKGKPSFIHIKGRGLNIWSIPEFKAQVESFDSLPDTTNIL